MLKSLMGGAAAIALLAACSQAQTETPRAPAPSAGDTAASAAPATPERTVTTTTPDTWGAFGLNLETIDPDVHPGDDFYAFMNGAWLAGFDIPADRSRYGMFTLLSEKSEQRVRHIIEDLAAAGPDPSTVEGKVAAFFNAYMDTAAIEAAGLDPVQPYFDQIDAIETREDLARVFAAPGFSSPIGGWVDVDSKQTDQYIFYVTQSGLGLPDRDYYLEDTGKNPEIRAAYLDYLTFLLTEAGATDPAAAAEAVLALETEMAKAHWDRTVGRNRNLTYNKLTRAEVEALAGDFPVGVMLDAYGLGGQEAFVVRQVAPTAEEIEENGLNEAQVEAISGGGIGGLLEVAANHDLETWKHYLKARFLASHADVLPRAIDDANFAFYGTTLRGQEEQRERWKRGVSAVENALGEAVGKVYAARHFPPENKAAMDELVANLRKAMAANLDDIDWMGEATKEEARAKLDRFTPKIGYPETFETYDGLTVTASALSNDIAASAWRFQDMLSKLGQPIDPDEWFMLPQTVNAYYSPNRNEIVFPAAILQPPFFNLSADPAINYGAIGGVIGHEIGHGFDDQGSRSDGDGVLRNWWTDEDRANFEARTNALVAQYNTFCPLDGGETCMNGALALGENIGDLGGLSMAYRAYRMSLGGEEAPVIDGLTGDQRFFLAWAQVWRSKYREEAMRQQMITGPHSLPEFRVNGVVRNFDEWYEAFGVTEEHALYIPPEERVRIW